MNDFVESDDFTRSTSAGSVDIGALTSIKKSGTEYGNKNSFVEKEHENIDVVGTVTYVRLDNAEHKTIEGSVEKEKKKSA